jgi:hypothetical protein
MSGTQHIECRPSACNSRTPSSSNRSSSEHPGALVLEDLARRRQIDRQHQARLEHAPVVVIGVGLDPQLAGLFVPDHERGVVVADEAPHRAEHRQPAGMRFRLRQELVVDVEQELQPVALIDRFLPVPLGAAETERVLEGDRELPRHLLEQLHFVGRE